MCCGPMWTPPGIPIEDVIHDRYPEDVKAAWKLFDDWWHTALKEARASGGQVSEASMPENVKAAWKMIREAPIPVTGEDSCYVIGVKSMMATE